MTSVPPPFDPELAAALELIREMVSPGFTLDEIPAVRQNEGIQLLADIDLTLDGASRWRTARCPARWAPPRSPC